jgi:hypothetical protein
MKGEIKGKLEFTLEHTYHGCTEGKYRYSSALSLVTALNAGGWSTPRPVLFTLRKGKYYPLYRRLGGPLGQSGGVMTISTQPRFDPQTVQPQASRYTNYAIQAHF